MSRLKIILHCPFFCRLRVREERRERASEHDLRQWPRTMTTDHYCRKLPRHMTVEHDTKGWLWTMPWEHHLRMWPLTMTSDHYCNKSPGNTTVEHETGTWLHTMPFSNVNPSCSPRFQTWKLEKQIQYEFINGCRIASSKELDAPTSVPVISAIISSSLNTLMSKSS